MGPVGRVGKSLVAERMTKVSKSSRLRQKRSGLAGHPYLTPVVQAKVPDIPSYVSTHAVS